MKDLIKAIIDKIPLISFFLSLTVAWLIIPVTRGFPMVPFIIFFMILSILVFIVRKDRTRFDTSLFAGILVISTFLLLRSNEVIQFIDFVSIVFLGSILIIPLASDHALINLLIAPFFAVIEALTGKNAFPSTWSIFKKNSKPGFLQSHFLSILVTLLLLGVTIPLLSSANPFFNQLMQNVLQFFDLKQFAIFFQADQVVIYVIRFWILLFLAYIIPRILTASSKGVEISGANLSVPVSYIIPKVAMGILLIIFFITQAQLYFATFETLQSMGYTNSRLTNEVFLQVTIVAFIIFFLAYLDKSRRIWNKRLTYFLILEAFFLVGIAFKSVIDYSFLWGLTEKRLWGYATMLWLTGALFIFLYYYIKKLPNLRFFQTIIAYSIFVLVAINFANFDYLISHFSKARTQSGVDYAYLTKLSTDASYYRETLNSLIIQIEKSSTKDVEKINAARRLLSKIDRIIGKYSKNLTLNSFNFSEYNEYLDIKTINTEAYRAKFDELERKFDLPEEVMPQQFTPSN